MDDVCYCGHVYDEHLDTTMEPCDVDGCECVAFDPDPVEHPDECSCPACDYVPEAR